jgi:MoaA/NifB/PqqE/SkfB family radical SAM enzyme
MLLDEEKARRLPGSGLTELNVSIDAARPATYERVRRGGRLEVVHTNLTRLLRARREARSRFPMIGLAFVMLNENEGELPTFVEQAAEMGVDFINTVTYASYDWGFRNRRTRDSYRRELDAARARMEQLGVRCKSFPSDDVSWSTPGSPFRCSAFWGGLGFRVTADGHVTLGCCTPFKETFSYGCLLEQSLREIWNGPLFRKNREVGRSAPPTPTCVSCDRFSKRFFVFEGAPDVMAAGSPRAG